MVHKGKEQEPEPVQDHLLLPSVLVVCGDVLDYPCETDVRQYMETREKSGGGPVKCVTQLDSTYVVDFHDHRDGVNVVRRGVHSMGEFTAYVFLYDEQTKSVYSGHQAAFYPDEDKNQVLICEFLFTLWGLTADDIKARMECLGNAGCVRNVQCLDVAGIAIVDFERSEDATRVADMEQVIMPVRGDTWPVSVYLLRQLPSDLADIPTDTASREPVEQTLALERRQVPGAPVTSPHDSQTMPAGTSIAEGEIQKEENCPQDETDEDRLVQDFLESMSRRKRPVFSQPDQTEDAPRGKGQTELVRRTQDQQEELCMEDRLEELIRANDQPDALVKVQVDARARARVQYGLSRSEARLQREVTLPPSHPTSTVSQLETEEKSSVTSMEDQVSQPKPHDNQTTSDLNQLRDEMDQMRDRLNASDIQIQMLKTENIQIPADLEKQKRQCHEAHQIAEGRFGLTFDDVASNPMQDMKDKR